MGCGTSTMITTWGYARKSALKPTASAGKRRMSTRGRATSAPLWRGIRCETSQPVVVVVAVVVSVDQLLIVVRFAFG